MKKSSFRVIAEGLNLKSLSSVEMPTENVDHRTLTLEDVKDIFKEEFGKVKDVEDVEAEEPEGGWGDAELEKELDWMKTLKIKEFLDPTLK